MAKWTDDSFDLLDDLIRRLEDAWRVGGKADLNELLPPAGHAARRKALVALIETDQEMRWQRGDRKTVQQYLAEWPELEGQSDQLAELQAAEEKLCAENLPPPSGRAAWGDGGSVLPARPQAIHIRCPHCHNPLEIVEQAPTADVTCPQCGSRFTVADDATVRLPRLSSPDHAGPASGCPGARKEVGGERERLPSLSGRGAGGDSVVHRISHFELIELLGQGAFGSVWKASDTRLNRIVALKVPRRGQFLPEYVEGFLRESRSAAALEHENIVPIYESGEADGLVYIASRYIEGQTLDAWVAARASG